VGPEVFRSVVRGASGAPKNAHDRVGLTPGSLHSESVGLTLVFFGIAGLLFKFA
jgi:hypothetical protein